MTSLMNSPLDVRNNECDLHVPSNQVYISLIDAFISVEIQCSLSECSRVKSEVLCNPEISEIIMSVEIFIMINYSVSQLTPSRTYAVVQHDNNIVSDINLASIV